MVSVGSPAKVAGIDHQKVINAVPAFAPSVTGNVKQPHADSGPDISVSGRLKSSTAAVLDAASRLTRPQTWSVTKATSSDESVVQAVSDQAKPGTYSVGVESMATAQTTASAIVSSISTVIGIGTLKIELGSWNASQTTFAMNPNWPKANVTMGPKDTTLERVRDKINAAGIGVIASVVSDATGSRLVLRSTTTGTDNGFKVEATPDAGTDEQAASALAAMGFDPSKVNGGGDLLVPAQDAKVSINGRELRSAQNLVEDDETGLSLRVKSIGHAPVNIHVESDTDAIRDDIHAFALTYNELSRQLSGTDDASDDDTAQAAHAIQSRVQQAFAGESDSASMSTQLRAVGVQMNPRGQLEIDADQLARALREQPQQVQRLFTAQQDSKEIEAGLARRLADIHLAESAGEADSPGVATTPAQEPAQTAAGALFRQKLLEQYTQADGGAEPEEGNAHDRELAMQASDA